MRRRTSHNTVMHLTGAPGSRAARVRISGHLVIDHLAELGQWSAQHFAGARVELAPGLTVYAADVCKLFRLEPGGWTEIEGPCATPEVAPAGVPMATPRARAKQRDLGHVIARDALKLVSGMARGRR